MRFVDEQCPAPRTHRIECVLERLLPIIGGWDVLEQLHGHDLVCMGEFKSPGQVSEYEVDVLRMAFAQSLPEDFETRAGAVDSDDPAAVGAQGERDPARAATEVQQCIVFPQIEEASDGSELDSREPRPVELLVLRVIQARALFSKRMLELG